MMNTATQATQQDALNVASVFLTHPNVRGVEVVGSVARERRGNDLDLVVVTTGVCYATFMHTMRDWDQWNTGEDNGYYAGYKSERRSAALQALKFDTGFRGWLMLATKDTLLDLHLMPEDWHQHVDEIQTHLPHHDPNFVRNIAKDRVELWSQLKSDNGPVKEAIWP